MKPLGCLYTIVRFVPHFETSEFANVGIVLACPQTGYFNYLLQDRRSKRVTDFFTAVDRAFYLRAIKAVEEELRRLRAMIYNTQPGARAEALRALMMRLAQPRETILQFDRARVVLTPDPEQELQKKYEHFVEHSFATPEYVEHTMNFHLRSLLSELRLEVPFKPAKIGDETLNARFDFVQSLDGRHHKVIKALNLKHDDANEIAAHGDVWIGKLGRLKRIQELPNEVLINVALPESDNPRYSVGAEIASELTQLGVVVVPGGDATATATIRRFAETPLRH